MIQPGEAGGLLNKLGEKVAAEGQQSIAPRKRRSSVANTFDLQFSKGQGGGLQFGKNQGEDRRGSKSLQPPVLLATPATSAATTSIIAPPPPYKPMHKPQSTLTNTFNQIIVKQPEKAPPTDKSLLDFTLEEIELDSHPQDSYQPAGHKNKTLSTQVTNMHEEGYGRGG